MRCRVPAGGRQRSGDEGRRVESADPVSRSSVLEPYPPGSASRPHVPPDLRANSGRCHQARWVGVTYAQAVVLQRPNVSSGPLVPANLSASLTWARAPPAQAVLLQRQSVASGTLVQLTPAQARPVPVQPLRKLSFSNVGGCHQANWVRPTSAQASRPRLSAGPVWPPRKLGALSPGPLGPCHLCASYRYPTSGVPA